ncbi:hypothetical protein B4U37_02325 [Sutcliffiella horikoshii]|uniref:Uncharacterized protein n=1 Tax=Sutcliffiella horikoshii TaxID=79883 RepID=A0ABM6KEQ3_9BACI|nr:hypothetical protein B4U37_02325 [Sutcliffiella horikoshii]
MALIFGKVTITVEKVTITTKKVTINAEKVTITPKIVTIHRVTSEKPNIITYFRKKAYKKRRDS